MGSSYAARYHIDRAAGRPRKMPVELVLEHFRELEAQGFTVTMVARAAGLQTSSVHNAIRAQRGPVMAVGKAIMGVTPQAIFDSSADRDLVPATGTTRRVRALKRLGWRCSDIAEATGLATSAVEHATSLSRRNVASRTRKAVKAFYEANKFTMGPSARTAREARRKNYAGPLAWDDETIEDPRVRSLRNRGEIATGAREERARQALSRYMERRSA